MYMAMEVYVRTNNLAWKELKYVDVLRTYVHIHIMLYVVYTQDAFAMQKLYGLG